MSQPIPTLINNTHYYQQQNPSQCDSSSNFTQDEIQIIRSYIGNLSIQKRQNTNDNIIDKVVERIQKETQLETKSAKHIQHLIYKLIRGGESSQRSNINCERVNVENENIKVSKVEEFKLQENNATVLQSAIQTKPIPPTTPLQDNLPFPSRSLFKSWNQPIRNPTFTIPQTQTIPSPAFRKINLFTQQPSIQILKSSTSSNNNGFISLNNDNNNKFSSMIIQAQNNNNETMEIPSFSKKSTNQFKQTVQSAPSSSMFISRRKIKPTQPLLIDPLYSPQQKIQWSQSNIHDCHMILQRKQLGRKSNLQGKDSFYVNDRLSGIYNEYFYSNYDRIYFNQQNQINKLINLLGFDCKRLKFKEFKTIKSVLPKPRLFNSQFISNQITKLNDFRSQLRQAPKQVPFKSYLQRQQQKDQLQLVVGRQVIALHPVCGHLHLGTILAIYKQNQYMIKFTRPQLGTQKVLDINISTRTPNNTNKSAVENLDYQSMVVVIKLLEYKGQLIEKFREYNNTIEMLKSQGKQPDNHFLQQYGWVGSMINILSMGLRHIMSKFRLRGLNAGSNILSLLFQSDQQLVGKNFSSLLINPLNLMSKQLQFSPEQSDIDTSNQIKKMASNRSNIRIEQTLKRLGDKHKHYVEQTLIMMNPQEKGNINALVKNFIGILLNLRFEGRNFNLQSNKFLDNIQKLIDPQYSQQFNEIHSNMHSIVKRINDNQ